MTEPVQYDLIESLRLRDAGITKASFGYNAAEWLDKAQATARYLAMSDSETDAESVLKLCPRPAAVSPAVTGGIFRGKGWKCVGYSQASKVSSHGRLLRRWSYNPT